MPTHLQIERFTLAFHRQAVERLRESPALATAALAVLDRWEAGGASVNGQRYRDDWRRLLNGPLDELVQAVCVETDQAATLRSASPLGFVLDAPERLRIRREAMEA